MRSSGRVRCLRSVLGPALDADVEIVMTTVDVVPSGPTLVEVVVCTTSAFGSGFACWPPLASTDASDAKAVATTTPPAASMTTVDTFFFDGVEGDCG